MKECFKDYCTEDPQGQQGSKDKDKDLIVKRLSELEQKVEGNARRISQKIESLKNQSKGDYADPRIKTDENDKQVLRFLSDLDKKVEANARKVSTKLEKLKRGKEVLDEQLYIDDNLCSSPPTTYTDRRTIEHNKKINDHILKLINELDGKVETNTQRLSQKIEEISQESGNRDEIVPKTKEKVSQEPKYEDNADRSVLKLLNEMDEKFETNIRRISEKLEALRAHSNDIRKSSQDSFDRGFQLDFINRRANDFTQGRSRDSLVQRLMANSKQQQEILATLSDSLDRNAREMCSTVENLGNHVLLPPARQFLHDEDCSVHQKLRLMIEENQERSLRAKAVFQSLMKHSAMEKALLAQASKAVGQPIQSTSPKQTARVGRKASGKGKHKRTKHERHTYKGHENDGLEQRLVHKIRQEFNEKLDEEASRLEMKIDRIHRDLRRARGQSFTEVIVDDGSRAFEAQHDPVDKGEQKAESRHEVENQTKELLREIRDIKKDRWSSQFSDLSNLPTERDELINKISERINEKAQGLEYKIERVLEFIKQEKERKFLKKEKKKLAKKQHRQSSGGEKDKPLRTLAEKIRIAKEKLKESEQRLSILSVDTTIQESLNDVIVSSLPRDIKGQAPQRPLVAAVGQGKQKRLVVINAPDPSGVPLKRKPPKPGRRPQKLPKNPKANKYSKRLKSARPKENAKSVETGFKSDEKQASSSSLSGGPVKAQTNESAESIQQAELESIEEKDPMESDEISSKAYQTDAFQELLPKEPEQERKTSEEKGQQTTSLNEESINKAFMKQGADFNDNIKNFGSKLDHVLKEIEKQHLWAKSSNYVGHHSSNFLTEHNELLNDHMQHLKGQLDRILKELSERQSMTQAKLATTEASAQASDLDTLLFEMHCIQRHLQRQSVLVVAQQSLLKRTAGKKGTGPGIHRERKGAWKRLRLINRQMAREQLKINTMIRRIEEDIGEDPTRTKARGAERQIQKREEGNEEVRKISSRHKKRARGEITAKLKSTVSYQKKASKRKKHKHRSNRNVSNQLERDSCPSESTEINGDSSTNSREIAIDMSQSQMQDYERMVGDAISQIKKMLSLTHSAQDTEEKSSEDKSNSGAGSGETVNWCTEENDNYTKTVLQSEYCVNESSESKIISHLIADEDGNSSDRFDKQLSGTERKDSEKPFRCPTLVLSQASDVDSSFAKMFIEKLFSSSTQSDEEDGSEDKKIPIKIFLNRQVSSSRGNITRTSQAQAFIQNLFSTPNSNNKSESKTSSEAEEASSNKQSDGASESNGSYKQQGDTSPTEVISRMADKVTSLIETRTQRSESSENTHNKTSSKESEENQKASQDSRIGSSFTTAEVKKTSSQTFSTRGLSSSDSSPSNLVTPNSRSLTAVSKAESQAQPSSSEQTRSSSQTDSDEHTSAAERNPQKTDFVTRSLIWPKHFNASSSVSSSSSPNLAARRGTDSLSERYSSYGTTEVVSRTDSVKSRIIKNYLPPALFQRSSSVTSQESDRKVAQFLEKYLFSDSNSDQREKRSQGTQFSRSDRVSSREKSSSCSQSSRDSTRDRTKRSTPQNGAGEAIPSTSDSPWECVVETHSSSR